MSNFEKPSTEIDLDDAVKLKQIEELDPDNLFFVVPGSRLHDIIHDPAAREIDET